MSLTYGFTAQQIIKEGRINEKNLNEFKSWVKMENLPGLTDEQVVLFLLSCDNLEASKQTIKNFYDVRKSAPELFDSREMDRKDLEGQFGVLDYAVFPLRTPDGNAILFHRLYDTTYSNYKMQPAMKGFFMTLDTALYDNPPNGLIILFDMAGVGLLHLTTVRLHLIKVFFQYLQEAVPVKVKAVHVLNTAYFVDKVLAIIKPFIRADLLSLVKFHQSSINMEDFYTNCIPKQCLPVEFGGDLPSVRVLHEQNIEKLKQMQDFFHLEEQQRHGAIKSI